MDDLDILLNRAIVWSEWENSYVLIMNMVEFKERIREIVQEQQEQNKWAMSTKKLTTSV